MLPTNVGVSDHGCLRPFSPLFYGIRDVTSIADGGGSSGHFLSVPYFTGFVMLHETARKAMYAKATFSPLFYGIRDVTKRLPKV